MELPRLLQILHILDIFKTKDAFEKQVVDIINKEMAELNEYTRSVAPQLSKLMAIPFIGPYELENEGRQVPEVKLLIISGPLSIDINGD